MSEGFKETILSEEQQKRQEKFAELLNIMLFLSESFTDSNEAYEVGISIDDFKKEFEASGLKLEDYSLGRVLLFPNNISESDCLNYDTEDEKIEKFIRKLKEQQEKNQLQEEKAA